MIKLKINITREILEKTKSCQFKIDACAISEGVRDIFPNAYVVYSTMYPFPISYKDVGDYEIDIPDEAVAFQRSFDHQKSDKDRAQMPPFSFEIDIPDSVISKIGIEELKSILDKSETLSMV